MRGWGWRHVHHPEHIGSVMRKWAAGIASRVAWEDTFPLRRHDGEYRWFMVRGVPRHAGDGGFGGYTGTCVDIHERKALEERLAERTRALRLADRRKDEFLAMLAHDLRNPLGPITNAVAMMKTMEGESPAVAPLRQIIERQLDQLKRVIADMRDVTRVTQARDGDIVVALVSGTETTLKRFYREPGDMVRLQPANSTLRPIMVPARDVQIQGRLLAVLRKYR